MNNKWIEANERETNLGTRALLGLSCVVQICIQYSSKLELICCLIAWFISKECEAQSANGRVETGRGQLLHRGTACSANVRAATRKLAL